MLHRDACGLVAAAVRAACMAKAARLRSPPSPQRLLPRSAAAMVLQLPPASASVPPALATRLKWCHQPPVAAPLPPPRCERPALPRAGGAR